MTCRCYESYSGDGRRPDQFAEIRQSCPALHHVLLPDEAWSIVAAAERNPPDPAYHGSYLLVAFENGLLAKLTAPIHRFLLSGEEIASSVTPQYRKDLQERWLEESDENARHDRFRKFLGKVAELQIAYWIATRGFRVVGLEALGAKSDIIAESPKGALCSFEVKHIGQDSSDFREAVLSLRGETAAGVVSPYAAANFLLSRVYDAAVQLLRHREGAPVAVILISAVAWPRFRTLIKWLNWEAPTFLAPGDRFVLVQRQANPDLDRDLVRVISAVSLWIVRANDDYEYVVEQEVVRA